MRLVCKYDGPIGRARVNNVVEWLETTVGEEGLCWDWVGCTIVMHEVDPQLATIFKLKFNL